MSNAGSDSKSSAAGRRKFDWIFGNLRATIIPEYRLLYGYERAAGAHLPDRPDQRPEADVLLSAAERHLHGAVSPRASSGGGALPRRPAPQQPPGDQRNPLYCLQSVRARL